MSAPRRRLTLLPPALLLTVLTLGPALPPAALADPPPWAPAYGHRDRHGDEGENDDRGGEEERYYRHRHGDEEDEHDDEDGGRTRFDGGVPPDARPRLAADIAAGRCNRAVAGAILGGVAGGAIGSAIGKGDGRTAATVAGAIIGMVIGSSVGRRMDEADRYCVGQTLEYGVARRPVVWSNPDTGERYTVTPLRTYRSDGRYCREYVTDAEIGGRRDQVYGRACRRPDGSWAVVR